jgi:hypothetical protein
MTIRVQYHNSVYDIVLADTLQRLLDSGKIKKFYRYSDQRWITVGVDPVRNPVGRGAQILVPYTGPEMGSPQCVERPSFAYKDSIPISRN